ncbi:hypothetical protein G9A89_018525 [Geosiphon pyriformis]|nr:hypothetical protein G9A89_018525 [Geosiphon pyriformis]
MLAEPYQQNQQLGLNSNHYSAESAFNFYVNNRIIECLGGTVNIETARENFYTELFQHTNLPKNYSFAPIIREINQTIERYTQQQFPITYADKDKRRIQTPAATPKRIQLPSWKKHRVESPTASSYHYTLGSAINISTTDVSTSNATLTVGRFQFQSKQQKEDLLGPYREKELKDQEFTYQNLITENLEVETLNFQAQQSLNLENLEIETPNHQRQNNPNPELSNQQNLPPVIVINQPLINPVAEPIQQPFQLPPQQPVQQQPLQQPPQQPNLDPMAYVPIAKLDNFIGEEDDVQIWLNNVEKAITVNGWNDARALQAISYFLKDTTDTWYQSLDVKPQNFNDFKIEFVRYFSNNNSINKLANLFTTIKQGDTEAVTTYLGCFHRNLHQIQAIQADYFTAPQILNQFIRGLRSNLFQRICPMHPVNLPTAVTHARDFKEAELEANHAQAVNLVMNGSSELDSKLKQFRNTNRFQNQSWSSFSTAPSPLWQPKTRVCHNCGKQDHIRQPTIGKSIQKSRLLVPNSELLSELRSRPISNYLPANNAATNLSTASISIFNLSTAASSNLLTAASSNLLVTAPNNLLVSTINLNTAPKLSYDDIKKPETQNCSKLEISNVCSSTGPQLLSLELRTLFSEFGYSNQEPTQKQQTLTSNIPPATVTNNKSLATIFSFKIKELSSTPLFSGATFDEKLITAMYTDAKVDDQSIKLILDSSSADTDGVTKTPIGEIDDFPFKVNSIVTPIKVLVMEATQYQALIEKLLIKLEKKKEKPIWEAYQVSWADANYNKLLPILAWDDNNNGKEEQGKEPICETTINTGTNDKDHYELSPVLSWDDNPKRKQREELTWETNDLTWTNNEQEEASSRK